MGGEETDLALEAMDCSVNERLFLKKRRVVSEEAGRKIVRPIDDNVIRTGDFHRVFWSQPHGMQLDFHPWVDLTEASGCAI
jgi:hypothetical protein